MPKACSSDLSNGGSVWMEELVLHLYEYFIRLCGANEVVVLCRFVITQICLNLAPLFHLFKWSNWRFMYHPVPCKLWTMIHFE